MFSACDKHVLVADLDLQALGRFLSLGLEVGGRCAGEEAGEDGLEKRAEDNLSAPMLEKDINVSWA